MAGCWEGRQLSDVEVEGLGVKAQDREEWGVDKLEGQGLLWAVVPLMMMMMIIMIHPGLYMQTY
jgi:hypothetical protein